MDEPLAYLNDRWIPASAAAVPATDAGFVQGSTVAEQLRTFAGSLFDLDDHLARLGSLEIVGVRPGITLDQFTAAARELVAHNHALLPPGDDLGLSIFVTPGTYRAYAKAVRDIGSPETGRSPSGRDAGEPLVCLHTYPLPFRLWAEKYEQGQTLVTTGVEQVPSLCWPAGLKCRSRMHYYLADMQAASIDPDARALLLDVEGFVTEASTANVLIYNAREGLVSPPSSKILRGISLSVVFDLAARLGIKTAERELATDDVAAADEVLLTSTPPCLLPVARLNGHSIGSGRPGSAFRRILAAWSEMVGVDIAGQAQKFRDR